MTMLSHSSEEQQRIPSLRLIFIAKMQVIFTQEHLLVSERRR